MIKKRIQLGLIHVAVAMTLVPINSTLNRLMIKEMALSATLVAILASLPFIISPIQVAIGSYSDRHPLLGYRRSPYILAGLILCVFGLAISPRAAFLMEQNLGVGILVAILAFGAWGMGYNLASVTYLSLASEVSGEHGRGKTVAIMWFMMIIAIILTAVGLGRLLDPYTSDGLIRAFGIVAVTSLLLGLVGLIQLEPRAGKDHGHHPSEVYTVRQMAVAITSNPVARVFFVYLLLLLAAILGQDVLLEPFGAEAFNLSVTRTTQITSVWGTFVMLAILVAWLLEGRINKKTVAHLGNHVALLGFLVIMLGGITHQSSIFYTGVTLLGFGTGLSTVANLSLMFDLTSPGQVGLFIGAWGFSSALARLVGSVLGGALRDVVTQISGDALFGYLVVFGVESCMLLAASFLLTQIDVRAFQQKLGEPDFVEKVALAAESS